MPSRESRDIEKLGQGIRTVLKFGKTLKSLNPGVNLAIQKAMASLAQAFQSTKEAYEYEKNPPKTKETDENQIEKDS